MAPSSKLVAMVSFHRFRNPKRDITPNISTISPLSQCLYNSFFIFGFIVLGTWEAAREKSNAARSASEKAECVLYSHILFNCS